MSKKTRSTHRTSTLYIKNMVCNRCIRVVKEELEKLHLTVEAVTLGEVVIRDQVKPATLHTIRDMLEGNGFELIEDKRAKIIEQIKVTILGLVHDDQEEHPRDVNYSKILSDAVGKDYHYLSTLFSSIENITIEKYIILQKIELAKELLKYNEYTLSEIAFKLGYSSVQHLSNQFKKVTGLTPSYFKSLKENTRKPLDHVDERAI